MLQSKVFLVEECRNLKRLLDDTLRHAYGTAKSEEFFRECFARLDAIREQVQAVPEPSTGEVHSFATQLDALSDTITRIERSHISELSWPFAVALKDIALSICRKHLSSALEQEPLFFFSAEGGLFKYRVYRERKKLARRRIFNVVFPRSLKNWVLLHTILGHEIGHVAYAFFSLKQLFETKVTQVLLQGTPLGDPTDFKPWLRNMYQIDLGPAKFREAFESWRQEYFCDLFGLLVMGPSFLPAHCSLFHLLDGKGAVWSVSHPPHMSRFSMIEHALDVLKWEVWPGTKDKRLKQPLASMYVPMRNRNREIPNDLRFIGKTQVEAALKGLKDVLATIPGSLYEHPEPENLGALLDRLLNGTPAVQTDFDQKEERWMPVNEPVDFRHILFAGWLAAHSDARDTERLSLFKINRLCDRSILHQQAIATWSSAGA